MEYSHSYTRILSHFHGSSCADPMLWVLIGIGSRRNGIYDELFHLLRYRSYGAISGTVVVEQWRRLKAQKARAVKQTVHTRIHAQTSSNSNWTTDTDSLETVFSSPVVTNYVCFAMRHIRILMGTSLRIQNERARWKRFVLILVYFVILNIIRRAYTHIWNEIAYDMRFSYPLSSMHDVCTHNTNQIISKAFYISTNEWIKNKHGGTDSTYYNIVKTIARVLLARAHSLSRPFFNETNGTPHSGIGGCSGY